MLVRLATDRRICLLVRVDQRSELQARCLYRPIYLVIYCASSNFANATLAGVHPGRDCPRCFHIDVAPSAGGAEFEWRAGG